MKLVSYFGEFERVPTKLSSTLSALEGLFESLLEPLTYKHQEHYLCFDHDFDNEDDDDDNDDEDNGSIVDKETEHLLFCLPDKSSLRESLLNTQASLLPTIIPTTTPERILS